MWLQSQRPVVCSGLFIGILCNVVQMCWLKVDQTVSVALVV